MHQAVFLSIGLLGAAKELSSYHAMVLHQLVVGPEEVLPECQCDYLRDVPVLGIEPVVVLEPSLVWMSKACLVLQRMVRCQQNVGLRAAYRKASIVMYLLFRMEVFDAASNCGFDHDRHRLC